MLGAFMLLYVHGGGMTLLGDCGTSLLASLTVYIAVWTQGSEWAWANRAGG